MSTREPGPPEEVPAQDPIEELVHTMEDVAEGELLADEVETETEIVIDPAGGEVERLIAERDEYLAHLQRTQAEFDNYRKRMLREQTAYLERATAGLIEQLLPVLDAFELALNSAGTDVDRLRKGVELVYAELLGALEKAGLELVRTFHQDWPDKIDGDEHGDVEYALTRAQWEHARRA